MLKTTFINVGYGDAILVESIKDNLPYTILIDGGEQKYAASSFLNEKKITKIDLLICTHFHLDHVVGLLDVVANFPVGEFWGPVLAPELHLSLLPQDGVNEAQSRLIVAMNYYWEMVNKLAAKGTKLENIYTKQNERVIFPGLAIKVLAGDSNSYEKLAAKLQLVASSRGEERAELLGQLESWLNEGSAIVRFSYAGKRILLLSDVPAYGMADLLAHPQELQAEVMKISHHGQLDSMNEQLAQAINPDYVITCVSKDRKYNGANEAVYQLLESVAKKQGKQLVFGFSDALAYGAPDPEDNRAGYEVCIADDASIATEILMK